VVQFPPLLGLFIYFLLYCSGISAARFKGTTQEFKEQILRESQEVGNVSLVARRHNISPNTIHTWRRKAKKIGSTKPLPADEAKRIKELEARLAKISTENDRLKRIVAEKELQITIMEEVRDLKNPR
jgi:transposase